MSMEVATLIFSAIVTVSTVVYAALTWVLVSETRKMRMAQTEPRIALFPRSREEFINFCHVYVQNCGAGPAYDLRFQFSIETPSPGAHELLADFTRSEFFKTGMKYLGPGQMVESGYTDLRDKYDEKIVAVLNVTVTYSSATKQVYSESFRLDFSEFRGLGKLGRPHLYSIAQSLEKIEKNLGFLVSGFKRLQIDTFGKSDRERETQEQAKRLEEMRQEHEKRNT